jgi:diguanylate cyclase (GGDEF)-like protein
MHSSQTARDHEAHDVAAPARRRAVLLTVAVAIPSALVLLGATPAWTLFALPIALSIPLGGRQGLAASVVVAALMCALASGRDGTDGVAMTLGLAAFAAAGIAVGVGYRAQERTAARIAGESLVDRLTGVHNYAFFEDALPRECRRAERYGMPLSLILLDLDRFKAFNDRHGHDAGNRLLTAVGEAIRANSRASDIAARFGGEEFALIVPGPAEEAMEAAERIRAAVAEVRVLVAGGETAGTTISAGVADFENGEGDRGERLLDQADKALYHSKSSGRDRVSLFAPEHRWAAAS